MNGRLRRLAARLRGARARPGADLGALEAAYAAGPLAGAPETFVLTRILGADLEPRHRRGQTRENLAFVLAHEPPLEACEKRWVVNRIADAGEEAAILALLAAHGQTWLRLPFVAADYARAGWDTARLPPGLLGGPGWDRLDAAARERLTLALYAAKNAYAMNNNGARNAALADGRRTGAKWVLPWDGNCFLTAAAWASVRAAVAARPWLPYHLTPMARVPENAALLDPGFAPDPAEEPQILFRRDAAERFDAAFVYGRRPKVALFWRLGVPGPWDAWRDDPWDPARPAPGPEAGAVGRAGWVARLGSGQDALEAPDKAGFLDRGAARRAAIAATLDRLDAALAPPDSDPLGLTFYSARALGALRDGPRDAPLRAALCAEAAAALGRGPWSVTQKTTLPPSRNLHDYWHPAPYWHPNPIIPGGRPYLQRDGKRVPGTLLYEPLSDRYDRTRLQRLFDDVTALALAAWVEGSADFAAHAARLVAVWFVEPSTRMAPHLRYAQVRLGWNRGEGVGTGIIEFKDLYYMLDAVRLLEAQGALGAETRAGLCDWLAAYLGWLAASPQGARERASGNNHGTYYDLQTAAVAAFLGDRAALRDALTRAQGRLVRQIDASGAQPEELARAATAHYCHFNLQGWLGIARIGRRSGRLRPDFAAAPWDRLAAAVAWTLERGAGAWPFRQIDAFDADRRLPLAALALDMGALEAGAPEAGAFAAGRRFAADKPRFSPHDGIAPWWALSAAPAETGTGAKRNVAAEDDGDAPREAAEGGAARTGR